MTSPPGPRLFPEVGREVRSHERGVLPFEHLRELANEGVLAAEGGIEEGQIQPASIDLRLGSFALQVRASFLPGRASGVLEAAGFEYISVGRPAVAAAATQEGKR